MDTIKIKLFTVLFLSAFSMNAAAVSIEIAQSSLFLSLSPDPLVTSLQDDQLGIYQSAADPSAPPKVNSFGGGGFDVSFTNAVNSSTNLGSLTWSITNSTGGDIANSQLMGFLDADIGGNEFWNEYGLQQGTFAADQSWEIDEPGWVFGDIYDHLQDTGVLDNTNNVPAAFPEDVSLALGFNIVDWLAGETIVASFLIADTWNGQAGLAQFDVTDVNKTDGLYFSASIENIGVIPIPGTGGLMLSGLILMAVARYRQKFKAAN